MTENKINLPNTAVHYYGDTAILSTGQEINLHDPALGDILTVRGKDGRNLFTIHRDGTVSGDVQDASEAAAIFCREVERITTGLALTEQREPA